MKEIKSWQCSLCLSIFTIKSGAAKCEKNCAKMDKERAAEEYRRDNLKTIADEIRLNLTNPSDIGKLIEQYVKQYLNRTLKITNMTFRFGMLSITHSAPIGKKTNWSCDRDRPTGYFGWSGQISGTTTLYKASVGDGFSEISGLTDVLKMNSNFYIRGLHTGSGHGGDTFSYDYKMFLDDFPKLKAMHNVFDALSKKQSLYVSEQSRLDALAWSNIMETDQQVVNLEDGIKFLQALIVTKEKALEKRRNAVVLGKNYQAAVKVSDNFDYDKRALTLLYDTFGG